MTLLHVLLDVDGVLIQGRPGDGRFWTTDLQADLGIDPAELKQHFFDPYWPQVLCGSLDLEVALAKAWPALDTKLGPGTFVDYWFAKDAGLNTGLLDQCAKIRAAGHPLHLATNQEHLRARYLLQSLRLAHHVDGMFYSAALGACKPDPQFFAAISEDLGKAPSMFLLIDDTLANVEGARAFGMNAIHFQTGQSLSDIVAIFQSNL